MELDLATLSLQSPSRRASQAKTTVINSKIAPNAKLSNLIVRQNRQSPKIEVNPSINFESKGESNIARILRAPVNKENLNLKQTPTPITPLKASADVRQRKGAVSTASPRTPNVNQINSKKQRSQLARFPLAVATSSSMPIDRNDPFLVPPSPPAKQVYSPASLNKSLRDQVNSLRNQLKDEMQSKSFLQSKLNAEKAERLRLEMELSILRAKFDKNK